MGNAVKFARFIPADFENQKCFSEIKEMIVNIHNMETRENKDGIWLFPGYYFRAAVVVAIAAGNSRADLLEVPQGEKAGGRAGYFIHPGVNWIKIVEELFPAIPFYFANAGAGLY